MSVRESRFGGSFGGGGGGSSFEPKEIEEIREKIVKGKKLKREEAELLVEYMESIALEAKSRSNLNEFESEKVRVNASLLRRPIKPLRSPDKIIRVYIGPYITKEGVFNDSRFTFLKVADGDWLLGEELSPKNSLYDTHMMSPLIEPSNAPSSTPLRTESASPPPSRAPRPGGYAPPPPPPRNPPALPPQQFQSQRPPEEGSSTPRHVQVSPRGNQQSGFDYYDID